MKTVASGKTTVQHPRPKRRSNLRPARVGLHAFFIVISVLWLFPILWTVYTSFRPYSETARLGYVSLPQHLTLTNYADAWIRGELLMRFANTMIVVIPSIILILLLSAAVAYGVSHFRFRFGILIVLVFTAGNLLPPQVIITPLYRMYLALPLPPPLSDNGVWYDQYFGLIAIHVAFQMGFAVFVLSNYMRSVPKELTEAALCDGASVLRTFWQIILPMTRPALAALSTLQFTWLYNDFFWALVLMPTGDKRPITTGLNDLQGLFFSDNNLLAAGALMIALPTLLVYLFAQRQLITGLSLGLKKE